MQAALDPADLQAIADLVLRSLTPMLAEIREIARRATLPQPRPAESPATASAKSEILCREEVVRLIGVSKSTHWRMEKAGRFPARIQISPKRVGWRRAEVEAWIAARSERSA